MNIDRMVFAFAGVLVLTGVILTYFVHEAWLVLPGFVGANMLQAAFTGFCPLAFILKKTGAKPGSAFNFK